MALAAAAWGVLVAVRVDAGTLVAVGVRVAVAVMAFAGVAVAVAGALSASAGALCAALCWAPAAAADVPMLSVGVQFPPPVLLSQM